MAPPKPMTPRAARILQQILLSESTQEQGRQQVVAEQQHAQQRTASPSADLCLEIDDMDNLSQGWLDAIDPPVSPQRVFPPDASGDVPPEDNAQPAILRENSNIFMPANTAHKESDLRNLRVSQAAKSVETVLSQDYAMALTANNWDDDDFELLAGQDHFAPKPVAVDYDDLDEDAMRRDEENDVPVGKRQLFAMGPPPPKLPQASPFVTLSRQTTASTIASDTSADFTPGARARGKRRFSDLDTDATSDSGSSSAGESPKRRQLESRTPGASRERVPPPMPARAEESDLPQPVFLSFDEKLLPSLTRLLPIVQFEAFHLVEDCEVAHDFMQRLLLQILARDELLRSVTAAVEFLYDQCAQDKPSMTGSIVARLGRFRDRRVLEHLDFENDALCNDLYGGLGSDEPEPGRPFGGCVQFSGQLIINGAGAAGSSDMFVIALDEPAPGPSTRFTRRFGSDRLLRLRVPRLKKEIKWEDVVRYFDRPFVFGSLVYRTIFAKDGGVFLMRTDETLTGLRIVESDLPLPARAPQNDFKITVESFFEWANDPAWNDSQVMGKWVARIALFFSESVPGVRVKKKNIVFIPDIIAADWQSVEKPPSEKIMTDGCGYANLAVFEFVRIILCLPELPGSIQFRLAGAKGLLIPHPTAFEESKEPMVWIRDSMNKIKYAAFDTPGRDLDPAMLTLDIVRTARVTPAKSSAETIVNMGCNGVPSSVFIDLMKTAMKDLVTSLTTWDSEQDLVNLCATVERLSGRVARNQARLIGGEARARGLGRAGFGERDVDDPDPEDEEPSEVDPGGAPVIWEQQVIDLLQATFQPKSCGKLTSLLERVVTQAVKKAVQKYRVDLPLSATAFIAPDPFGVLEEGQIYFRPRCSSFILRDGNGRNFKDNILRGSVLVMRHPCKLPTDAQKVTAVGHAMLYDYQDILLCSIKGMISPASLLAGGDYDGDIVNVVWHPSIVTPFTNADLKHAQPPMDLNQWFEPAPPTVRELRNSGTFDDLRLGFLLGALDNSCPPGKYSKLHDIAVFELGYENSHTELLAWMFCQLLDSAKSGKRILPTAYKAHKQPLSTRHPPEWKATEDERARARSLDEALPIARDPKFVMIAIYRACTTDAEEHIAALKTQIEKILWLTRDKALASPWEDAQAVAKEALKAGWDVPTQQLKAIEDHVRAVYDEYKAERAKFIRNKESTGQSRIRQAGGKTPMRSPTKSRDMVAVDVAVPSWNARHQRDCYRFARRPAGLSAPFYAGESMLPRLKASCAYVVAYEPHPVTNRDGDRSAKFAFDVAMRELCAMKVQSHGGESKAMGAAFYAQTKMFVT